MTDIEVSAMRGMREDGYTLQEIGDCFSVSREYVRQLLGNRSYSGTLKKKISKIPYIGLRDHIDDNKLSLAELCRKIDWNEYPGSQSCFSEYLRGNHEMKMWMIDKLIEITNIPYENLFRKE